MASKTIVRKAQRAVTASRAWLKRETDALDKLADTDEEFGKKHVLGVEDAILNYENRLQCVDKAQAEYELVCPDNEVDKSIEEASDFSEECVASALPLRKLLADYQNKLKDIKDKSTDSDSVSSQGSANGSRLNAKLPQIHLPKFNGDVTANILG